MPVLRLHVAWGWCWDLGQVLSCCPGAVPWALSLPPAWEWGGLAVPWMCWLHGVRHPVLLGPRSWGWVTAAVSCPHHPSTGRPGAWLATLSPQTSGMTLVSSLTRREAQGWKGGLGGSLALEPAAELGQVMGKTRSELGWDPLRGWAAPGCTLPVLAMSSTP